MMPLQAAALKALPALLGVVGGFLLRVLTEPHAHGGGGPGAGPAAAPQAKPRRRRARVPMPAEELKMTLVVNDALQMGRGKIAAQVAHAAVGLVQDLAGRRPTLLAQWEECGTPKICLKASSDAELLALAGAAAAEGLPTFIVEDAGRTQVSAGSRTVLAVGPAPRSRVDRITGHLRLL